MVEKNHIITKKNLTLNLLFYNGRVSIVQQFIRESVALGYSDLENSLSRITVYAYLAAKQAQQRLIHITRLLLVLLWDKV